MKTKCCSTRSLAPSWLLNFGASPRRDDMGRLVYLTQCIKESLRLTPIVPFVSRKIHEDVTFTHRFNGYKEIKVPGGTEAQVNIYVLHRHPDIWENPEVRACHMILEFCNDRRVKLIIWVRSAFVSSINNDILLISNLGTIAQTNLGIISEIICDTTFVQFSRWKEKYLQTKCKFWQIHFFAPKTFCQQYSRVNYVT